MIGGFSIRPQFFWHPAQPWRTFPAMKDRRLKFSGAVMLLAFFVLRPLSAQVTNAAATEHHLLWKAEGKSNIVYLMGSIHLMKPEDYPLPPPLEAAYSNSQITVFETDIAKMTDISGQLALVTKMQLPDGDTIQQHLTPETYAAFARHVKDSGMPMELFENMKPALAVTMLDVMEMTKLGADPEKGLDKYFDGKAHEDGKQIIGLETADFQMDLLTSLTRDEEEMLMKESLEDMDKAKDQLGEIMKSWRTGDSQGIEKLLNDAIREQPALYKRMLTDRNRSWIPRIENWLNGDKNVLVIVGSAHLVGNEGVVELLRKKGFKLTQQ
jgi:uncharacterized protein YbaP (TraB family)